MGLFSRFGGIGSGALAKSSVGISQATGGFLGNGKLGTKSVASQAQAGLSATVVSQSRYVMTFFEKQNDFATAIRENDKKALAKLKQHNQDLLDQKIILNVEGIKQDFAAYKQYLAELWQALGEFKSTFKNMKDAYGGYTDTKELLNAENRNMLLVQIPKVYQRLIGLRLDVSIPKSIKKMSEMMTQYGVDDGNLNNLCMVIETRKAQLQLKIERLRHDIQANKNFTKQTFSKAMDEISAEYNEFSTNVQTAFSKQLPPAFNEKVQQLYTHQLSSAMLDYYQNWQMIEQLIDYQTKIEEKLSMMTPDPRALNKEIKAHTDVSIARVTELVSRIASNRRRAA